PRRAARGTARRAACLHPLVARLVVSLRLPPDHRARAAQPAARGPPRPRPPLRLRPSAAATGPPLPRPMSLADDFAVAAAASGVHGPGEVHVVLLGGTPG